MELLNEGTFDMFCSPTPLGGGQLPKNKHFKGWTVYCQV